MLVDLFTLERDLEDLMLKEYPVKIFSSQIGKIILENGEMVFIFSDLDYGRLSEFLVRHDCTDYRYSILDENSRLIEDNNTFHNPVYH